MADEEPKPLTYIPEVILKKRKSNEEWAIRRRQQLEERNLRGKQNKAFNLKTAEQYIQEHRNRVTTFLYIQSN